MGSVIQKNASVEAIEKNIDTTLRRGRQRTDGARDRVEARLGPHEPVIGAARQEVTDAEALLGTARGDVIWKRELANRVAGEIADEVWNAMLRPARDPVYVGLFPGGVATITEAPAERCALLLGVLARKLLKTHDPRLDSARLEAWAVRLDGVAAPLDDAERARERASVGVFHANKAHGYIVRMAWADLPRLKRELKNDGLTEAEVHAIIPDVPQDRGRVRPDAATADEHDGLTPEEAGNGHDDQPDAPVAGDPAASNGTGGGDSGEPPAAG